MLGGKRQRGRNGGDAAERTAGAFKAAAARARNPEYRGYDHAERTANLAGEAAQVLIPSYCPLHTSSREARVGQSLASRDQGVTRKGVLSSFALGWLAV